MAIKSMTMAAAMFAAALHAAVTEQPAVPVGNPDDQIRFFWGLDWRMYDSLPPAGFNMAMEHSHGTFAYDLEKGKGKDGPMPDYEKLAEKMKRDDFVWCIQLMALWHPHFTRNYPRIGRDGKPFYRATDTTAPGCMDELRKYAEYHADVAAKIAAKTGCTVGLMPSSEERLFTRPTFAPHAVAAYKAATGRDVPPEADGRTAPHWSKLKGIPADRVIDKDHPVLAYYRWFWKEGDGFDKYYQMAIDMFREKLGYMPFSMYDPVVWAPPLWGSGGNVSHINHWVYGFPNPYIHAYYVSEQNAFAGGCPGQHVVTMVQGIAASSLIAPTNDLPANVPEWRRRNPRAKYITPPPDMMLEQIWSVISRKIDGFGFHGWDALWVLGDDYGRGRDEYRFTNPESRKTIERFMRDVAVPLGPLLKAAPEPPAEVAVLDCYAATVLSGVAWSDWERPARHCGFLAEAANLAPITLFEESIAKYGIPKSVKVVLASGQDVMTKETAAALKAFQARGGKIVADSKFVPAIKADAAFPSEKEVAVYIGEGETEVAPPDDKLPEDMKRAKDGKVRDLKYRARAAALAKTCRAWAPAHVETANKYVFLRTRTYGSTDYVFAVNDKRDFGEYVGPWRRVMEKGVPNEAVVTVRREAGAVYDLVKHQSVPFSVKDGKTLIPVKYETSDGRLLMVVDRPLGALKVSATPVDGGARVTVETPDRDAMIPIKVVSATGKPFYGVVAGGI